MLFRSKPNLFSSFTINLGPLYVERVLDSMLTLSGVTGVVRMRNINRYEKCLSHLKGLVYGCNQMQYIFIQFYLGYFYQQLSKETDIPDDRRHFAEKALCHYQHYLDLPPVTNDSRYFAQWQSGVLQEELGYPWEMAKSSLLRAGDNDSSRGEGLRRIVRHYLRTRDWEQAYQYSVCSIEKHFDRNPVARQRWFVEFEAYDWNLLNTHLRICYKMHYPAESVSIYHRMIEYERRHLHEFANIDIRRIHSLDKLFHQQQRAQATA